MSGFSAQSGEDCEPRGFPLSRIEIPFAESTAMPTGVAVLVGDDVEALAAALLEAPDTRFHKPVATFGLGENYHGSLRQDLFVCPSSGMDAAYWVLWVSSSADQEQDDRAR